MTLRRHLRNLALLPGLLVAIVAVAGPWLVPGDPMLIVDLPYGSGSAEQWLGTDHAGRDVWHQVLAGGRPLVVVPLVAVALTVIIGTATGMFAAFLGGTVDAVISRLDTIALAIPAILVLLLLLHSWGNHAGTLIVAILIASVPFVSRLARAATLQAMNAGYVEQAIGLGAGTITVVRREILPNIIGPIIADAGTRLAIAITLTAVTGFLGFDSGQANWGAMVNQNFEGMALSAWGVLIPAVLLAVLAVSANLFLDRLAERMAP